MGVWIDTDLGFDDLWAVIAVARSGLAVDGASLVFGCATLDVVLANAGAAQTAFGWTFPFHRGLDRAILGSMETAERVLGPAGMPSAGRVLSGSTPILGAPAFVALSDWLSGEAAERRILALGPLSNVAALCIARPDLAARITDLVWMGGGVTSGNHTASAEYNAFADPEALAVVLAHGLPLRMVDLDACRRVQVFPEDADPIRRAGGRNAELLADLFAGYVGLATSRGRPGMAVYDPVAAAAFLSPELVEYRPARIEAELTGIHTRGRTVVDARPSMTPNAVYAARMDVQAVRAFCLDVLIQEAAA